MHQEFRFNCHIGFERGAQWTPTKMETSVDVFAVQGFIIERDVIVVEGRNWKWKVTFSERT